VNQFQHTFGNAEFLHAQDSATIEHHGDTSVAIASDSGRLVISGKVTERAAASEHGSIFACGDTERVRAANSGSISLLGSPEWVEASDSGDVIVYGEPRKVVARRLGFVTIISLVEKYEPDSVRSSDGGSVRLIKPGSERASTTSHHLEYHLKKLLPQEKAGLLRNPLYKKYLRLLLQQNHDEYLTR